MNQAQIPQFPRGNISRSSLFTQRQENDGEGYDVEHHQREQQPSCQRDIFSNIVSSMSHSNKPVLLNQN